MLKKCRYLVHEYDKLQLTALHWAAMRNHIEIVKLLLDNGAKIDCFDVLGRTPLYLAGKMKN